MLEAVARVRPTMRVRRWLVTRGIEQASSRRRTFFLSWLLLALMHLTEAGATEVGGDAFYFDAERSEFSHGGARKVFSGDVLALKKGALILAEHIVYHPPFLEASGSILGIFQHQVFRTSALKYHLETSELSLKDVLFVTRDAELARSYVYRALGLSPQERAFEKHRKQKIAELLKKQRSLLRRIRDLKESDELTAELLFQLRRQLEATLHHEQRVRAQKNPHFASRSLEQRKLFLRRRSFWRSLPQEHTQQLLAAKAEDEANVAAGQLPYLRIESRSLTKTPRGHLKAEGVHLTPCQCSDEEELAEPPPWSLRAQSLTAVKEFYLTLEDPYVLISGFPVFYLPQLRFPLKTTPQSGLLSPELLWDSRFGYSISPALYLYLSENADMTITSEVFFQNQDLRLRGEHRFKDDDTGLFQLRWEGMQHSAWLEERALRESRRREWFSTDKSAEGLRCEQPTTELEKQFCNTLWAYLHRDQSQMRGKVSYEGKKDVSPQLSLFARGEIYSDHRYAEELEVSVLSALSDFEQHATAKTFAANRYHIAWYGEPVRVHVKGYWGDHFLMDSPFVGLQNPLALKTHTPFYRLLHSSWMTLYLRTELSYKMISELKEGVGQRYITDAPFYRSSVGGGDWASWNAELHAPFRLDPRLVSYFFLTMDHRYIRPRHQTITPTRISSPLAGLSLSLPLTGKKHLGMLPGFSSPYYEGSSLEHQFDFGAHFSLRPWVWRYGNYGGFTEDPQLKGKTYFASDDEDVAEKQEFSSFSRNNKMSSHKKITFFTRHSLNLAHHRHQPRSWLQEAQGASLQGLSETMVQRALQQPAAQSPSFVSETDFPLEVSVSVDYDLEGSPQPNSTLPLEASSAENLKTSDATYTPWQDLKLSSQLNYPHGKIAAQSSYNFQEDRTAFQISVGVEDVLSSDLSFEFTQGRETLSHALTRLLQPEVRTYVAQASTRIIPQWLFFAHYSLKYVSEVSQRFTSNEYGVHYLADHRCWGLRLSRYKPFAYDALSDQAPAIYRLQLKVILGPSSFETPNLFSDL